MQKSGGAKDLTPGKSAGLNALPARQGIAGGNLAAQRLVNLERVKDKPVVPKGGEEPGELMDHDVGSGLREVEGWKVLEPE